MPKPTSLQTVSAEVIELLASRFRALGEASRLKRIIGIEAGEKNVSQSAFLVLFIGSGFFLPANPLKRWAGLAMGTLMGGDMEHGLSKLKAHVEENYLCATTVQWLALPVMFHHPLCPTKAIHAAAG